MEDGGLREAQVASEKKEDRQVCRKRRWLKERKMGRFAGSAGGKKKKIGRFAGSAGIKRKEGKVS